MSDASPGPAVPEAASRARGSRAGKRRGAPIGLCLIVVLAATDGALYLVLANRASQTTDAARIAGDEILVSSPLAGQISSLAKAERDAVVKGESIASLDDRIYRSKEREASADKELADQGLALAQARLDQAESDLETAAKQLDAKVVPRKRYEAFASEKASAEATARAARAFLSLAEAQVQITKAELESTQIKSPIDGVVARKWLEAGSSVQAGQAIYTLYDIGRLRVDADFGRSQLSHIAVGDRADIWVDAFPGKKLGGKVVSVGLGSTSQSELLPQGNVPGSFMQIDRRGPVTIEFDNPSALKQEPGSSLRPGMSAKVRITTGR